MSFTINIYENKIDSEGRERSGAVYTQTVEGIDIQAVIFAFNKLYLPLRYHCQNLITAKVAAEDAELNIR